MKAIGAEEEGSDDDTGAGYVEETPTKKGKGKQIHNTYQLLISMLISTCLSDSFDFFIVVS